MQSLYNNRDDTRSAMPGDRLDLVPRDIVAAGFSDRFGQLLFEDPHGRQIIEQQIRWCTHDELETTAELMPVFGSSGG